MGLFAFSLIQVKRKRLYYGDTPHPGFEITALTPRDTTGAMTVAVRIHNQDGALVVDGSQTCLMKLG